MRRTISNWPQKALMILSGLTLLSACSTKEEFVGYVPCPRVSILSEAKEFTQFRPGGEGDASQIEFQGKIMDVNFSCAMDQENDRIVAKAKIAIEVARGPAASYNPAVQVFLALTEGESRIIDKDLYTLKLNFGEQGQRVAATQRIKNITIPLNGPVPVEGHDVFVGFQLTQAQTTYNRTHADR